jgi:integrase
MVQLQLLCGARPQEVLLMRPCEVTQSEDVWRYLPSRHKTEHLDRSKVIMLGPRAQDLLKPWLARDPDAYCFSPAETADWQRARARKKRAPRATARKRAAEVPPRQPGSHYTRHSYRVAIQRACRRAGVPVWSPHRLRHTRATAIRQAYGLEAAKAVLGHSETKVTEIYAERDLGLAARVMHETG